MLGYADQHYWRALAGELTAEELVALPLGLAAVPSDAATSSRTRAARAGRPARPRRRACRASSRAASSSGSRSARRSRIGRRLLIADEPTGDLDEESAREVLRASRRARRRERLGGDSREPRSRVDGDRRPRRPHPRRPRERGAHRASWRRPSSAPAAGCGFPRRCSAPRASTIARGSSRATGPSSCIRVDGRVELPSPERARLEGARGEVLEARGVTRRYGAQVALDELDATFLPGRAHRRRRAFGLGQVDAARAPRRASTSRTRARCASGDTRRLAARPRGASGASARAHRRRRPGAGALGIPHGARERRARRSRYVASSRTRRRERAADALAAVGLAAHAERRVDCCRRASASGSRSRASSRAHSASSLADEPTSRLDAATTLEIGSLLAELAHDTGTTVVCATHDPLLIGLADREVRLRDASPLASRR